ncbi:hypothetical protein NPIL_32361 [Nephila pilipes]|uniref:Uncharacterized protein n=1 Tax=Nephila pilipes TaxID=299642 RepID=A0A8X6U9W3_NEPPI|nr:hypothetical protein NPIL_32361 [Nephila pilipes]
MWQVDSSFPTDSFTASFPFKDSVEGVARSPHITGQETLTEKKHPSLPPLSTLFAGERIRTEIVHLRDAQNKNKKIVGYFGWRDAIKFYN